MESGKETGVIGLHVGLRIRNPSFKLNPKMMDCFGCHFQISKNISIVFIFANTMMNLHFQVLKL